VTIEAGMTLGGRYRLDERIAGGGMGEVWRGTDQVLGRTVAVKVLLPSLLNEPGFGERFRGEARTMATVNHPGIVDVYDYGSDDAVGAYLVMEYVEGEALSHTLSKVGRLTPARTMDLVAQAAEALQAAHDRGVVHRDVKPANLLVRPDGRLVLTDFGIARSALVGQLTAVGSVLGTASYISPEQASGDVATPLSDVYALGVVAYQCLSGRRPFDGDNPLSIAMKHVHDRPAPLPLDAPPAVRAVVERAMAKDPAARFPTATAFAQAARQAASGRPAAPAAPTVVAGDLPRTAVLPRGAGSAPVSPGMIGVPARPVPSTAAPVSPSGAQVPPPVATPGAYSRGSASIPPPVTARRSETTYMSSPKPPVTRTTSPGDRGHDNRRLVLIGVLVGLVGVLLICIVGALALRHQNGDSSNTDANQDTSVTVSQPPANPVGRQSVTSSPKPGPKPQKLVDVCRAVKGRQFAATKLWLTQNGFTVRDQPVPGGEAGEVIDVTPCEAAPRSEITVTHYTGKGGMPDQPSLPLCDSADIQDCASWSPIAPDGGPGAN
jgi:serine/threonine protein kinase